MEIEVALSLAAKRDTILPTRRLVNSPSGLLMIHEHDVWLWPVSDQPESPSATLVLPQPLSLQLVSILEYSGVNIFNKLSRGSLS